MNHKLRKLLTNCLVVSLIFFIGFLAFPDSSVDVQAKSRPTYTIKPSSKLYGGKKNKKKLASYLLNSYMKRLEKTGGGTLILKKGTYYIYTTVYIPSNVTIKCNSGVKFIHKNKKGYSVNMFAFCPPSIAAKGTNTTPCKIYGYSGTHDVTFIGNNTTADAKGTGIVFSLGHSQNISISGVKMSNMAVSKYHFIELNSSKNVTIDNCSMNAGKNVVGSWKECINVDSDDNSGFNTKWASNDKTCCSGITITNCSFTNAGAAIGTHNYSANGGTQIYHKDITISGCTFSNIGNKSDTSSAAVRMLSWKNVSLTGNTFTNCTGGKGCPIRIDGCENVSVSTNTFYSSTTMPITATYSGKIYTCNNNTIYWSKSYDSDHPDCVIYNTYYSYSSNKAETIVKKNSENYYDYYSQNIFGNLVSDENMAF